MQMQEIKLEEIEPTIRKIFAAGGDFTFYPKGTSMHPFVEQGRDKITLAPIQDQVRKYDVILYKRKNGAFVLHRVVGKRADGYIFRGDNQFVKEYGIKKEQMIGRMTEKKLKSLMKSGEYNYVHCNCLAVANIDIAKYAYKYGKTKVIIHSHQDMKLRHLKSEILHRYNRNWLKNKDIIRLACSEQAARWIHGDSVTEKGKVIYIHNAIEVDNFKYEQEVEKKYRKEFGLENKFVVGCVGRFAYQKNYEFLAEIFSEIRKKNKTAVLVCVGDEGGMKEIVLEKFKKLKVMDSLRLLGIREDVAQIMQMFDVFVLPSRWEGLGIVYIEAQAAGVQTFASDVVPKEAKVTELLHYISLKKSPEVWAREILKYENGYVKRDTTEEIKKKGYNIQTITKRLEDIYLNNKN